MQSLIKWWKRGGALRHFATAFMLAALLYVTAFYFVEHRRGSRGPWRITFSASPEQAPQITINQPALGITSLTVVFPKEHASNSQETLVFDGARKVPFTVPFGQCVFLDTTFLPGTVTLQCFGHEIELIPRVLIIDHMEHFWSNNVVRVE